MEILQRFSALMSETLHFSGTPGGLAVPLGEVHARLLFLADQERLSGFAADEESPLDIVEKQREEQDMCRFAVYAWVDEKMLNAARPDAPLWLPLSLQCRYFDTSDGGRRFFQLLDEILEKLCLPSARMAESDRPALDQRLQEACGLPPHTAGMNALKVFALCLLYGFRGACYDQPELLARVRKACHNLLSVPQSVETGQDASARRQGRAQWRMAEAVAWVLVPLVGCVLFGLYCADILSGAPIRGF
ncbi:MAG: DotU family type IV/VI secretion system protein [Desulfovibrionaceae bacterium]|nr:DotU family type IV/VI secretion system protein [Desulfovibrionaceae bacterium]